MTRTYSSLAAHKTIYYTLYLFAIDNWGPQDKFILQFDNMTPLTWQNIPSNSYIQGKICGSFHINDHVMAIVGKISHSNTSLTLTVSSSLNQDPNAASYGITELTLLLGTEERNSIPGTCINTYGQYESDATACPCRELQYQNPSNPSQCLPCDSSCSYCHGPLATDCLACNWPATYNGTHCIQSCPSNCYICDDQGARCTFCQPNFILQQNGTCLKSCTDIIVSLGAYKVCQTTCQVTNTFQLWNGLCSPSCDPPFVQRITTNAKFCDLPCAPNSYLYRNGLCLTTCPYYKITAKEGYLICDVCPSGHFLYPDKICRPTCPSPYIPNDNGANIFLSCSYPCQQGGGLAYYDLDYQVCIAICEYPSYSPGAALCTLNLTSTELKQAETVANLINYSGKILSITATITSLFVYTDPGLLYLITMAKMLPYIRYMNVKYSPYLLKVFKLMERDMSISNLIHPMSDEMRRPFPDYTLEFNFGKYGLNASFLVNFWQPFVSLLILIGVLISLGILEDCTEAFKSAQFYVKRAKQAIKWNFSIMYLLSFFNEIIFFASLDLRTSSSGDSAPMISIIVCALIHGLLLTLFIKLSGIIKKIIQARKNIPAEQRPLRMALVKRKWRNYKVLYVTFADNSTVQQLFIPLFVMRVFFVSLVISFIYQFPLIQIIVLTFLSSLQMIYLGFDKPPKEIRRLWEYIIQEILILVVCISVLIISILDISAISGVTTQSILGIVIISCIVCLNLGGLIYLFVRNGLGLWQYYKQRGIPRQHADEEDEEEEEEEDGEDNGGNNEENNDGAEEVEQGVEEPVDEEQQLSSRVPRPNQGLSDSSGPRRNFRVRPSRQAGSQNVEMVARAQGNVEDEEVSREAHTFGNAREEAGAANVSYSIDNSRGAGFMDNSHDLFMGQRNDALDRSADLVYIANNREPQVINIEPNERRLRQNSNRVEAGNPREPEVLEVPEEEKEGQQE